MKKVKNFFKAFFISAICAIAANLVMLLVSKIRGDFALYTLLVAPSLVTFVFLKVLYETLDYNKFKFIRIFGVFRCLWLPLIIFSLIMGSMNGAKLTWENDWRYLVSESIVFVATLIMLKHFKGLDIETSSK